MSLQSYSWRFCPYCGTKVSYQGILPGTNDAEDRAALPRDHAHCNTCRICLTCQEKSSHGWRTVPRQRHRDQ